MVLLSPSRGGLLANNQQQQQTGLDVLVVLGVLKVSTSFSLFLCVLDYGVQKGLPFLSFYSGRAEHRQYYSCSMTFKLVFVGVNFGVYRSVP